LRDLLNVINENHLKGIKFFATSRPDPDIVSHVDGFGDKQLYRLEKVPVEEAQGDIRVFLSASIPNAPNDIIDQVVSLANDLFIYAATILKYLDPYGPDEKVEVLDDFLSKLTSNPRLSTTGTSLLDELYCQILKGTFPDLQPFIPQRRLQLLHTFVGTAERTSTSTAINICTSTKITAYTQSADAVLKGLHAVLYTENDKVLWYHKSFPDFLFDKDRSEKFWCNQVENNQRLMVSCFRVMEEKLRFNIGEIESSFVFDHFSRPLNSISRIGLIPAFKPILEIPKYIVIHIYALFLQYFFSYIVISEAIYFIKT